MLVFFREFIDEIKKYIRSFSVATPNKTIYMGIESSGKSLCLAKDVRRIIVRNSKWNKITGNSRVIWSNLRFSSHVELWAKSLGVEIKYWTELEQLTTFSDCDLIIDEIGNYFDSRGWANLSIDVRKWLTQSAKAGVEVYGTAQAFGQIDVAFRRLVDNLKKVTKLVGSPRPTPTRPPVEVVWGIIMMRQADPLSFKDEKPMGETGGFPSFFFIVQEDCLLYDTRQVINVTQLPPFRHQYRKCLVCDYEKIIHS